MVVYEDVEINDDDPSMDRVLRAWPVDDDDDGAAVAAGEGGNDEEEELATIDASANPRVVNVDFNDFGGVAPAAGVGACRRRLNPSPPRIVRRHQQDQHMVLPSGKLFQQKVDGATNANEGTSDDVPIGGNQDVERDDVGGGSDGVNGSSGGSNRQEEERDASN